MQSLDAMQETFRKIAHSASNHVGSPWAFLLSMLAVIGWALSGPLFDYSDTWQLVINTATTVITFLMVFLIQNTQNRDAKALHLKLDELLRAMQGARNELVDLEDMTDEELAKLEKEFRELHEQYAAKAQEVRERRVA